MAKDKSGKKVSTSTQVSREANERRTAANKARRAAKHEAKLQKRRDKKNVNA